MDLKFSIPLQIVSKKNSKRICGKRLLSSKAWMSFESEASLFINLLSLPKNIVRCESAEITFYFEDKRKRDLTNASEGIFDLLVDCGILVDDNISVIPKVILIFGGYEKGSARNEILIKDYICEK